MWNKIIDSSFFTILYPVSLILAVLAGYYIAKRLYVKADKQWQPSGIESSVVAIFGLLLSFTFLSSNNTMKDRLKTLHETYDAAENFRRQSLFAGDTIEAETQKYLINYIDIMSDFKNRYLSGREKLVKDIETLNNSYITKMRKIITVNKSNKAEVMSIVPYFNTLNSYSYRIIGLYVERTPKLIIILIIVSSWLIGILAGFLNGFNKSRHYLIPLIFIVLVSLCIRIILDLDNPFNGTIQPVFSDLQYEIKGVMNSSR